MAESDTILNYAHGVLSERRNKAKGLASERRAELYEHVPRLRDIEAELSATAAELIHTVAAGGETAAAVRRVREKNLSLQEERAGLLRFLNLPENYLEPPFFCQDCKDSGYVGRRMCKCLQRLLREEKLRRLNSASSLSLSSFESFQLDYYPTAQERSGVSPRARMEEILGVCRRFAAGFDAYDGKNLLLLGATGLGKTHLSLAIAADVIARGYSVVYGSVQDLFRRAEAERFSKEGGDTLDELLACDLLILDDLGAEFVTSFTTSTLYNLVNTRLNRKKATIISTNLPLKELNALYADRIVSRLLGNYRVLQFLGNDIRIAQASYHQ